MILPFGEALRYRRDLLRITQGQLADLLDMHQSTLSKWEKQAIAPKDSDALIKLADALGADPGDIVTGRVYLRDFQDARDSLSGFQAYMNVAYRITQMIPQEQIRQLEDLVKEVMLVPLDYQEDTWEILRTFTRSTAQQLRKRAKVAAIGMAPLSIHETEGDLKEG